LKVGVFYPPLNYYGGATAVTVCTVNALADKGYEVLLYVENEVCNKEIAEMMGDPLNSKVRILVVPTIFKPRWLLDLYQNGFRSLFLKYKCDLLIDIFTNFLYPWTDVVYIHYPGPYLKPKSGYDIINYPITLLSRALKDSRKRLIIANSYFTAHAIKKTLNMDAVVVYPPVDPAFFAKENEAVTKRENLAVSVGRINFDKRLETLPYIAHLTKSDANFAIVGFVHDKTAYELIVSEARRFHLENRFTILTDLTKKNVVSILRKAKVYLHPPVMEHFGISIAEAMAAGCIPIVYDCGGVNEFVPAEYRYHDLEDAAKKVDKAIESWSVKKSRKMVEIAQKFTTKAFSNEFSKVFSEFVESSSHPLTLYDFYKPTTSYLFE